MRRKLKLAFVLQGRFEAFDLALALVKRGHDVKVFINYPKRTLLQFRMDSDHTKRFVIHGVLVRLFYWLNQHCGWPMPEAFLHCLFGRWAALQLKKERWDAVFGMSGVSEEFLQEEVLRKSLSILIRASAHIISQYDILTHEEKRIGAVLDKPTPWMISREKHEYQLANIIRVICQFSRATFLDQGFDEHKIWFNASAFPTGQFKFETIQFVDRRRRILAGGKLRVLFVGALSCRKGIMDLANIVKETSGDHFEWTLVGPLFKEVLPVLDSIKDRIVLAGKIPQSKLKDFYTWADVFVFPTLEDGFPQVLAQAHLSGLPILATTHCSAPDFIQEGKTGWVFPIRHPELFAAKLRWCHKNRLELSKILDEIQAIVVSSNFRTWDAAAREAEEFIYQWRS